MKVKKLIKILEKLDQDKEIFINTDWSFLNTEQPCFRIWSDIESKIKKWYFLKTRKYSRDILIWNDWCNESDIKSAKKEIKYDWGCRTVQEWKCYFIEIK